MVSLSLDFFFSSRRRHTRSDRDWSSDVCSSDLNAGIRFQYNIADSRIRAEGGHRAQAEAILNSVRSHALKSGMSYYELESRLALCEIKMKAAQVDAARGELTALRKDANARGYILIARKVTELMAGSTSKKA